MFKNLNNKKISRFLTGLTLIELLVVVGIVGLFISIVLVIIHQAGVDARNAAIESNLIQIRTEAEFMQASVLSYRGLCSNNTLATTTPDLAEIKNAIRRQQGNGLALICYADDNRYCVEAELVGADSGVFCLDSTGLVGRLTAAVCDGTNFDCR